MSLYKVLRSLSCLVLWVLWVRYGFRVHQNLIIFVHLTRQRHLMLLRVYKYCDKRVSSNNINFIRNKIFRFKNPNYNIYQFASWWLCKPPYLEATVIRFSVRIVLYLTTLVNAHTPFLFEAVCGIRDRVLSVPVHCLFKRQRFIFLFLHYSFKGIISRIIPQKTARKTSNESVRYSNLNLNSFDLLSNHFSNTS